jgi:hypothetical protein
MSNDKFVNGPINAFRLEGNINGINKVIYLFGDIHQQINEETKCDSYKSIDFTNYLYSTMENTNSQIKYDLFVENYSDVDMFETSKYTQYKYREKYINELNKFMNDEMDIYLDKSENNKIINKGAKHFINLRLHHIDVRSFFGESDIANILRNIYYYINKYDYSTYNYNMLEKMLIDIINLKNEIKYIINNISKKIYGKIEYKEDKTKILHEYINTNIKSYKNYILSKKDRINNYSDKIFKNYTNYNVKKQLLNSDIVNEIIRHSKKIMPMFDICINKGLELLKLGNISNLTLNEHENLGYYYGIDRQKIEKIIFDIRTIIYIIDDNSTDMMAKIMDIYCMRRFLDKKYVTNAIIYTGIMHTNNYLKILVRDFGFKLTHFEYSKLNKEKTLNLLESNKKYDYKEIFYKPIFKQCSNMKYFPNNFL